MNGVVFIVFILLYISSYRYCSGVPLLKAVNLIAELRSHFHTRCIYILHDLANNKLDSLILWRNAARVLDVGSLSLELLLRQRRHLCASPLYIIAEEQQRILNEVSVAEMFSKAKWIVFDQTESQLKHLNISFDCEFLLANWDDGVVRLHELYQISPEYPLLVKEFGDSTFGTTSWPKTGLYRRRRSLDGHVLKAAIQDDGIFITVIQSNEGERLGGYIGEIWCELERQMNFSSELIMSVDGGTGSELDGQWDGMVGMLVRGEAQVGASSFLMTTKRMTAVDYTHGLVDAGTNVYIKKPDKYLLPWSNTLAPFGPRLWICVITTMLLLTIFLSTTCAVINGLKIHDEEEFRLQNSWLYVFGIFCQQGHDVTPRSISGRIVYFTSYLCAVVLLAGYAGNYISFLSAGRPLVLPFRNFREMLQDGTYKLGTKPKSAQLDFFRNATDPLFKEVYEKLIDTDDLPADYDVGFQRVCESKYAFMTSDALMKKYAAQGSCEVIDIPQASIPGVTAMAVAKKSPYLGLINFNIQRLKDAALVKLFRERTLKKREDVEHRDWDNISLDEVIPNFSVFILGVLVSVIVLIFECFISTLVQRRNVFKRSSESAFEEKKTFRKNCVY